jgi:transposase InsO family protein
MTDGHRYILTCQNNLSKYLLAISMMTQKTDDVSLTFLHHVVLQYGIPNSIVTDHGSQFTGDIFKKLCRLLKVHKLNTMAHRPASNRALERAHKTMTENLRCFCSPRNND